MHIKFKIIVTAIAVLSFLSCDRGPKIISTPINDGSVSDNNSSTKASGTGIFDNRASNNQSDGTSTNQKTDMHTVVVDEVLPTQKYIYLKVTEGDEQYWIATGKQEVEVGKSYFFRGGLLKTNFESKEYNRVFDKVYLVSKIVPVDHGHQPKPSKLAEGKSTKKDSKFKMKFNHGDGFVKIAELVKNTSKYAGKKVKVTGQCTKLNPNIMGKNWIHLKDGTMDEYDFVLTSASAIPEGHLIQVEGVVTVDKDFGAGYKYDILLEEAVLINQ